MSQLTITSEEPLVRIRPTSGWRALDLRQVWRFRDLLMTLAGRDVKLRYRQTALGVAWVILQPLMAAGIFSFVFGKVAALPSDGIPYFVFSFTGLLAWNAFASTFSKASTCLVGNSHLISKVFFPRLVLPLSTLVSTLIDFAVALALMVVLMAVYHITPTMALLLIPVWLLLLMMMAMGAGLVAASLMVSYRDVQHILPVATQFLLYASPVAYAVSAVPERLRTFYFANPLSGLIEGFRIALLGRGELPINWALYSAAMSVAVFFAGAFVFKKMESRFSDVV